MTANRKLIEDRSGRAMFAGLAKYVEDSIKSQCYVDIDSVLTFTEARAALGVPTPTLRKWLDEGVIIARQDAKSGHWLISKRHIDAALSEVASADRARKALIDTEHIV